jgi:hypothetical protein
MDLSIIVLLACLLAMGVLTLITHELGHAGVAKLVRWECDGIGTLGVFVPLRKDYPPQIPRRAPEYFGGVAYVYPPRGLVTPTWQHIVVNAGGIIAQTLIALVLAGIWLFFDYDICLALLVLPLGNILVSAVPLRQGLGCTDGMKIYRLLRGGGTKERRRRSLSRCCHSS